MATVASLELQGRSRKSASLEGEACSDASYRSRRQHEPGVPGLFEGELDPIVQGRVCDIVGKASLGTFGGADRTTLFIQRRSRRRAGERLGGSLFALMTTVPGAA